MISESAQDNMWSIMVHSRWVFQNGVIAKVVHTCVSVLTESIQVIWPPFPVPKPSEHMTRKNTVKYACDSPYFRVNGA